MLIALGRSAKGRLTARPRALVVDTAWSMGFELATVVVSIVSFLLLGRTLGPAGYGAYVAAYAVLGPAMCLAWVGVSLAALERVAREGAPLGSAFRDALLVAGANGLVLGCLAVFVVTQIAPSLDLVTIVALTATELVGTALVEFAASVAWLERGYAGGARVRTFALALRGGSVVGLFAVGWLSVANLALAYVTTVVTYGALALAVNLRRSGVRLTRSRRLDMWYLRRGLSYGVGVSALGIQNDGDKVVMFANDLGRDTGLYAAAYRVIHLGLLPVKALLSSSHLRFLQTGTGEASEHVRRSRRYVAGAAVYAVAFGGLAFVGAPVVRLLVGPEFADAVSIVRWLTPLVLIRAVGQFPLNGLLGLGRTNVRTALLVGGSLTSMALYLALIPRWSWRGAIVGTMASEAILAAAAWVALVRCQRRSDEAVRADERVEGITERESNEESVT